MNETTHTSRKRPSSTPAASRRPLPPALKAELVDLLAEALVADLLKYPTVESIQRLDRKNLLPKAGLDDSSS